MILWDTGHTQHTVCNISLSIFKKSVVHFFKNEKAHFNSKKQQKCHDNQTYLTTKNFPRTESQYWGDPNHFNKSLQVTLSELDET